MYSKNVSFLQYTSRERSYVTASLVNFSLFVPTAVECTPLSQPDNGRLSCSGGNNTFNSTCRFKCFSGFLMIGSSTVTCGDTGLWNGPRPVCTGKFLAERHSGSSERVPPFKINELIASVGGVSLQQFSLTSSKVIRVNGYYVGYS